MTTRLSAKIKKMKKEGKLKDLPGHLCVPRNLQSVPAFEREMKIHLEDVANRNNPETLEKRRAFKREIDRKKIYEFERYGHNHGYNYDEWLPWNANNYIKSWYTVKRANGEIIEFARPNAGVLCGYNGQEIRETEQGVMVKLADVFPY